MKAKLFYLLFFIALAGYAQVVSIPDANFRDALLAANTSGNIAQDSYGNAMVVDANDDGEIQQAEAEAVYYLNVSAKNISSIEGIGYFTALRQLDCSQNQLTSLDLSSCKMLAVLKCANNNIAIINIKNGTLQYGSETENTWGNNPLQYICVDEDETAIVNNLLYDNGYSGISVNTYCSFTPGGDYNTITGKLIYDAAGDGCDTSDNPRCFMKLRLYDGLETSYVFTDETGNYNFYTLNGSFTVTPEFEEGSYFNDYTSQSAYFPVVNGSVETADFCIIGGTGQHNDLEVIMAPVSKAVPGSDAEYKMIYRNKGNTTLNGTVNCTWNRDLFSDVVSIYPMPAYVNDNRYVWEFSGLRPFEAREVSFVLTVNDAAAAQPVNPGDVLPFTAQSAITSDEIPADNTFVLNQKVEEALHGNYIQCLQGEIAPVTAIGEYLHYVVSFINTGTETASNVVISQEINEDEFDISSLQVISSSHSTVARTGNNMVRFIMEGANVADGNGHGNILFKIKTRRNLMENNTVSRQANIFFGYRLPVTTNEAKTTFGVLNTEIPVKDLSVKVYPNPANSMVTVSSENEITSVEVYDMQGRLLQAGMLNTPETKVDLSSRASGVYFIKVITTKGASVEKVIKE